MDALMTTMDGYIHPFWWFFMPNAAHLALKSKVDNCSLDRLGVLQRDGLAVDWRWIGMFMPIRSWSQFQWSIWGWRSIGFCLEKHYQSIEFCFVLIFLMFFLRCWYLDIQTEYISLNTWSNLVWPVCLQCFIPFNQTTLWDDDNFWFSLNPFVLRTASIASGKSLSTDAPYDSFRLGVIWYSKTCDYCHDYNFFVDEQDGSGSDLKLYQSYPYWMVLRYCIVRTKDSFLSWHFNNSHFRTYKQCTNHIFSDISSLEHSCSLGGTASAWYKDATASDALMSWKLHVVRAKQILLGRSCRRLAWLGWAVGQVYKNGGEGCQSWTHTHGQSFMSYLEVWLKSLAGFPLKSTWFVSTFWHMAWSRTPHPHPVVTHHVSHQFSIRFG